MSEFLARAGTFSVSFHYDTISSGLNVLKSNIIDVDKCVVVVSERTDLAEEVRGLMSLIGGGMSLCKIKEVIFILRKDLYTSHHKELIGALQNSFNDWQQSMTNWIAPFLETLQVETLSYDTIYRSIIGTSNQTALNASRTAKYRVERDKNTKEAFIGKYEKLFIAQDALNSLEEYEELSGVLASTESRVSQTLESAKYPEYPDMDLPKIKLPSTWDSDIVIVAGEHLSGVSVRVAALARSACLDNKSVLVIDLSNKADINDVLQNLSVVPVVLKNSEFLLGAKFDAGVCYTFSNGNTENTLEVLFYLYANRVDLQPDVLLINVELDKVSLARSLFAKTDCAVIWCSQVMKESIESLLPYISEQNSGIVWLSDFINLASWSYIHTSETARKLLGVPVAEPIDFSTVEVTEDLYNSVSSYFRRNERVE